MTIYQGFFFGKTRATGLGPYIKIFSQFFAFDVKCTRTGRFSDSLLYKTGHPWKNLLAS